MGAAAARGPGAGVLPLDGLTRGVFPLQARPMHDAGPPTPRERWNPFYTRIHDACAARPGAWEDHPWGDTVFKVKDKVFVFLGRPEEAAVCVKPEPEDLDGLLALPFVKRAPYIGRHGWVVVAVDDEATLELALDLVEVTYRRLAPKPRGRKG